MGIKTKHILTITIIDPETGLPCELEIRRMDTGALVGFDASFLAHLEDEDRIRNPYGPGVIDIDSDELERPERLTSLVLTSNMGEVHGVVNVPVSSVTSESLNQAMRVAEYYNQQIHECDVEVVTDVDQWVREKNGE